MAALFSKSSPDKPRDPIPLERYTAVIQTDRLVPGIDNIRFDVCLSSRFVQFCEGFLFQLVLKHSNVAELLQNSPGPPRLGDKKEFRERLQLLLINALNRANAAKNPQLEVLAQAAILRYLIRELQEQYAAVVAQAREKLKMFEGFAHRQVRGYELQELFVNFQKNKKPLLRRVAQELLSMIQEVRGDVVRKTREAFFGTESSGPHAIFLNPLLLTDDGRDNFLNLEYYVMLGTFQKDPDRFELVDAHVRTFLEWADSHSEEHQEYRSKQEACAEASARIEDLRRQVAEQESKGLFSLSGKGSSRASAELAATIQVEEGRLADLQESLREVSTAYAARMDAIVSAPENGFLLVDYFQTEQEIEEALKGNAETSEIAARKEKAERQQEALERFYDQLHRAGLIPYILAAYEAAKIYQDFCPPIHPQQLKVALVDGGERKKVKQLIREYRLQTVSWEVVEEAARRVRDVGGREIRATLVRFLYDFLRYQHDLRNFHAAQALLQRINIPTDPRQVELSEINHTLYRFLLPEEEEPLKEKVTSHTVLKADVRDSTLITAQLFERGLNPASYFSLNFFEPINKLLPRYAATKVFLEGDAVILAILEREGDAGGAKSVASACCLAREMIEVVRGMNERAALNNLPLLDLGIGICFQSSGPMYLMDGDRPIMISQALNESDRLSSCGKMAKKLLAQKNRFFNVFVMQVQPDPATGVDAEELLLHFNVQGVEINETAFRKLSEEISLSRFELKMPLIDEPEMVELYGGLLPVGEARFQKLVIRIGRVPELHPKDFHVVGYTDRRYYEVCCGKPVYDYVGRQLGWQ